MTTVLEQNVRGILAHAVMRVRSVFPARCALVDAPWFPDDGIEDGQSTYPVDEQNQTRTGIGHGIATGNFDVLFIPVSNKGFAGQFDVNGDGISLIARTIDRAGNMIESSDTARIFIQINSESSIPLGFSFSASPSGAQKSDLLSVTARVQRVYVFVETPTADPVNQPFLIIAMTKGVAISGLFGTAGLAGGVPAAPVGGIQVTQGGGGAAPGAAPGGAPSGGGGGAGGGGGGGYQTKL